MANVVGVEAANSTDEASLSDLTFSLAEVAAAFQRTAAALMAVKSGDGLQKVMSVTSSSAPMARVANAPAGESLKPVLATKTGISFVIPKNKLSGALVPVLRSGGGIWDSSESKKEDASKAVPVRKTRWGVDLTQDPAVKRGRALALQTRAEQIAAQLESGQLDVDSNEVPRSPSPPPVYDLNGQRVNTREGRRREQLERERREAIGECLQLNPHYKPPPGYKPIAKEAKLYIPVKDYPGYNFIGLILGPRGNTQKRMEAETGSKIAIRGKGAVKEGKGGRRDVKDADGAFEDLHVHITADSIDKVDAAVALIEPLLTPVDEDRNTHKRKQLRELAEMNGTMRESAKLCSFCGDSGHREWHCPKDKIYSFQTKANMFCQICGDGSHPTVDCPDRQTGQGKALDKEYLNFLEELGDGLAAPTAGSTQVPSPKLPTDGSLKEDNFAVVQPISTISTPAVSIEISETSRDPNQLADVIHGQQPMLITASGPQPIPSAWASVGMFPIGFEPRLIPRDGIFPHIDGAVQLQDALSGLGPPMDLPNSAGFSGNGAAFMYHGIPPSVGSALAMNALPPSNAVAVESSGGSRPPPSMQPMASGSYGRENVLQATDMSSASGKFFGQKGGLFTSFPTPPNGLPFVLASHISNSSNLPSLIHPREKEPSAPSPSMTLSPFWASPPSSSGPSNSLGPHMNPQKAVSSSSVPWEGPTHAQPPPPFWGNGPAAQQPPSLYHVPSPPPWDRTGASKSFSEQSSWGNGSSRPPLPPTPPPTSMFSIAGAPPSTSRIDGPHQSWNSRHGLSPLPTVPPPPPQPRPLPTNQPWTVPPSQIAHHVSTSDTFPVPRSSSSVWTGASPSTAAIPMPLPKGQPRPPHQIRGAMQTNQPPLQLHPPRLQQAGPNSELLNFTSSCVPTIFTTVGDSPDLQHSLTSWTQQTVRDRNPFESRSLAAVPSQLTVNRLQTSYQSHDLFLPTVTPALANANVQQRAPMAMIGALTNSNVHQQQVAAALQVLNIPANANMPQQQTAAMPKAGPPNNSIVQQHQALVQMHGVASSSNLHPTQRGLIPRLSIPSNPNVHQPQVAVPMLGVSSHPNAHLPQVAMAMPMLRSPTNANIQQQQQQQMEVSIFGMAGPAAFGGLPDQLSGRSQSVLSDSNIRRIQPPVPVGRPPWHFFEQNPRIPGPPVLQPAPAVVAAAETDAEYEKLMASVGVK